MWPRKVCRESNQYVELLSHGIHMSVDESVCGRRPFPQERLVGSRNKTDLIIRNSFLKRRDLISMICKVFFRYFSPIGPASRLGIEIKQNRFFSDVTGVAMHGTADTKSMFDKLSSIQPRELTGVITYPVSHVFIPSH